MITTHIEHTELHTKYDTEIPSLELTENYTVMRFG